MMMIDRRGLFLALGAALTLASASEAQRFDPRGSFDNAQEPRRDGRRDQPRRMSHDELRAIVMRELPVREMRTSGECEGEFWALIITREGHRRWVFLDLRDGRHLRTQSDAPACG